MAKKRIFLKQLRDHDLAHDDCIVRELEMTVDSVVHPAGAILQFWADVQLYGVDEAIAYVRNSPYGLKADAIQAKWDELKKRLYPQGWDHV